MKKEQNLLKEIEWIKEISRKIDNENNILIKRYEKLGEENFGNKTTNESLRNQLKKIKILFLKKKEELRSLK